MVQPCNGVSHLVCQTIDATQVRNWHVHDNADSMQSLRRFTILIRLTLAWFVLSLGAATASPLVQPQDIFVVCSSSGSGSMKLLIQAPDGSTSEMGDSSIDCPQCIFLLAPPPMACLDAEPAQPLAHALQAVAAAHIAALTSAPLPARGPPAV